jgi:hypothetical protein
MPAPAAAAPSVMLLPGSTTQQHPSTAAAERSPPATPAHSAAAAQMYECKELAEIDHARATFAALDDDGSGALSRKEIGKLSARLGHKWGRAELDKNFRRMVARTPSLLFSWHIEVVAALAVSFPRSVCGAACVRPDSHWLDTNLARCAALSHCWHAACVCSGDHPARNCRWDDLSAWRKFR